MSIIKSVQVPNGVVLGYHRVKSAEVNYIDGTALVHVQSWPNEQAAIDGASPAWSHPYAIALSSVASPEAALLAGELAGGTLVADAASGLSGARARKWAALKASREAAFDAPLVTPYGTFDSDKTSRDNIAQAVQLCDKLAARSMPSSIDFILYDNTTATLTATEMGTVGLLLGQKVQTAYATASALREQIEAATTIADVEAVTWPT